METRSTPRHLEDSEPASSEASELEAIHRYFPRNTHEEIGEALEACRRELRGSADRKRIIKCMETRLTPLAADGVD